MGDEFLRRALPRSGEVRIGRDRIDVWSVDLEVSDRRAGELRVLLSDDEIARAERFRFERHRRRFVAGRGTLRLLLGAYCDLAPEDVSFEYGDKGKPRLASSLGVTGVHFNLSHSRERALIAVGPTPLGVDVEFKRQVKEAIAIAKRYFSDNEQLALSSLPAEQVNDAFFTCWTRKEAYVKAVGDGLTIPLRSFDVTFLSDEPPRLTVRSSEDTAERWFMYHFEPEPRYVGAMAVRDRELEIAMYRVR